MWIEGKPVDGYNPFQKLFINTMVVTGMVVPSVIQIAKKLLIETMLHVKKNIKTY